MEASPCLHYSAIEVLLPGSDSENHEPAPDPGIDRPSRATALPWAQLKEVYLALQRLHVGGRQIRSEVLQLPDHVENSLAVAVRFDVLEVEHRVTLKVDEPGLRLPGHTRRRYRRVCAALRAQANNSATTLYLAIQVTRSAVTPRPAGPRARVRCPRPRACRAGPRSPPAPGRGGRRPPRSSSSQAGTAGPR
jgi:hypothetical protein